jgi:hypothetical protein
MELVTLRVLKSYCLRCIWQDIFSSPKELFSSDLGLTQPSIKLVLGIFAVGKVGRDVKLTTHLHLVTRLRMGLSYKPVSTTFLQCLDGETLSLLPALV